MYYISTDATLTTANLHSALASLNDEEVRDVLGGDYGDSKEQTITNWIMKNYRATWKELAGRCFYREKEKALEEVKKHFSRKFGMLLIYIELMNFHAHSFNVNFVPSSTPMKLIKFSLSIFAIIL